MKLLRDIIPLPKIVEVCHTNGKSLRQIFEDFAQAKKDWDEKQHPRAQKGQSEGGRFVNKYGSHPKFEKAPTWFWKHKSKSKPTLALNPKSRAYQAHRQDKQSVDSLAKELGHKESSTKKDSKPIGKSRRQRRELKGVRPTLLPTTSVKGDIWNKTTALQLEYEYRDVRGQLEELAQKAIDAEVHVEPQSWDDLSSDTQQAVEEKHFEKNQNSAYDSEVENWHGSGDAMNDARFYVAKRFDEDQEWAEDALMNLRESLREDGIRLPFTTSNLLDAIKVDYEYDSDVEIVFDDEQLQNPIGLAYDPETQLTMPGIEPEDLSKRLTPDMRTEITNALSEAFEKEAERRLNRGDIEPPDYLQESANESLSMMWSEMSDKEKYDLAKEYGFVEDDDATEALDQLPDKFDPLNWTSGNDYKRTQKLAKFMSIERGVQLLKERGVHKYSNDDLLRQAVMGADTDLWRDWVESSTSDGGLILQAAAADELHGRFNSKHLHYPKEQIVAMANKHQLLGGYEGIKALVRAKWETTQYLLDKAGQNVLHCYRGISVPEKDHGPVEPDKSNDYKKLPKFNLLRNGCASATVDAKVANGWGAGSSRVVLRIEAPRTAALSVPAYGQNLHGEREVVLAGTAWKSWDAWKGTAPEHTKVKIG